MKVNMENLSDTQRKLQVIVPADVVKQERNAVFKEIYQVAKVKGFRPGKAPVNVVEAMYKSEILSETMQKLLSNTLEDALREAEVNPINRPEITPPDAIEEDKDFEYTVLFEVLPEIELGQYKELKLKKDKQAVKDEDVDQAILHLREHKAEVKPYEKKKAVKDGDVVIVDFEGFLDGEPLKDLKRENVQFIVGEKKMIPEFEENVMGMKKEEEKEFDVTYDESFPVEEARGKAVHYVLKLKDVLKRTMPKANDELAKGIGLESIDELKNKIKEDLGRQLEQQAETKLRKELMDILVENNPSLEAPGSLVQQEAERLVQSVKQNMQQRGVPEMDLDEKTLEEIGNHAVRNVKASLVLGEISRKEEISVSEEEIKESLSNIAQSYNMNTEQIHDLYEKNNLLEGLEGNLAEQKVIDFIIENADVDEVPVEDNHVDNKP
ncbi:MAG: trigger factor [Candidatus Dadabacteria bacterium]|nr:MAG: trigger factor [Candidatus Dadabacteria bacterium]TDI98551.1 MAG: trigger factor [Candidatus Dadabacteria bacterium]